jgi:hypothetical protein
MNIEAIRLERQVRVLIAQGKRRIVIDMSKVKEWYVTGVFSETMWDYIVENDYLYSYENGYLVLELMK